MTSRTFLTLSMLFLLSAACATSPASSSGAVGAATGSRNVITEEEIRSASASNAFDLVRGLRPAWLYKRGPQSVSGETDIIVYVGRTRLGQLEVLREIPAANLDHLEFLDATAANFRFGAGHPYGAIVLSMGDRR